MATLSVSKILLEFFINFVLGKIIKLLQLRMFYLQEKVSDGDLEVVGEYHDGIESDVALAVLEI